MNAADINLPEAIRDAADGVRQVGTAATDARRRVTALETELEEARQELGRLRAPGEERGRRRAQDDDGLLWWIHDCGMVMESAERPGPHACDSCGNAPGPWAELWIWEGSTPKIRVDHPDDDQVEILVDGRVVASANYDDHGRDGMDAIERTALAVARAFGAEVRSRG